MRRRGLNSGKSVQLVDNLWKLETATPIDSIGGKDGVNNGCTVVAGKIGNAYNFDGNDFVNLSGINADFSGSWTIGCWFNTTSTNSLMRMLDSRGGGASGSGRPGFIFFLSNNISWIEDAVGNTVQLGSSLGMNDGNWHLGAISFEIETGTGRLFFDDNDHRAITNTAMIGSSTVSPFDVTAGKTASTTAQYYTGLQDEIFFIKEAITVEKFLGIWNNGNGIIL